MPRSTLTPLALLFAVTISSFPSPFTSPRLTEYAPPAFCVPNVPCVAKVPLPLPRSTLTLLEP